MDPTIKLLETLVSMKSVSADPTRRDEARNTAEFIKKQLLEFGTQVTICENEAQGLNPLILGVLGNDPHKKTIAVYSHYDVQPAALEDGWDTDPFILTEKEGYLYGRGASDDKGPMSATIQAIRELHHSGELPVNFRFIYEGEEESSSGGFEATLSKNRSILGSIDGIIILDTSWFGEHNPAMDYGFRGMAYMGIEIQGPVKDIHSGMGNAFREPMTDLIKLMSMLKDDDGRATVPGFMDRVKPLTDEERKLYENLDLDTEEFRKNLGLASISTDDKVELLMSMWRYPSISFHGIEGAFSGPGAKTVIPAKVSGKVSMRLVPDQIPTEIAEQFKKHVEHLFSTLNSPNTLDVITIGIGDWWYGDFENYLYTSAGKILKEYWKLEPVHSRSGGSIPIIPFMEKELDAPAIGLGVGQSSDGAHSQNERIRIKNLVGAKEVLKLYFTDLASY